MKIENIKQEELKENERKCIDCKCKIVFHTDEKIPVKIKCSKCSK